MTKVFAPGCALYLYKPQLAARMLGLLQQENPQLAEHATCCRHQPGLAAGSQIINVCAGCDRRYRELYPGISTISFWELLAQSETFPFPDYQGRPMAILDACPTRDQERVHRAIRTLLQRMNITLREPEHTGARSTCCGDSFFGVLPVDQVKAQMAPSSRKSWRFLLFAAEYARSERLNRRCVNPVHPQAAFPSRFCAFGELPCCKLLWPCWPLI